MGGKVFEDIPGLGQGNNFSIESEKWKKFNQQRSNDEKLKKFQEEQRRKQRGE